MSQYNNTLYSEEIIGNFGEGMKLAAFGLLRVKQNDTKKALYIDTNKQRWYFKLEPDKKYNNKECLFFKISNLSDSKIKELQMEDGWTYTRISGLTIDEWNSQYVNFLFLCEKTEVGAVHTTNNAYYKGKVLLAEPMKGKLFVKELHVSDYPTFNSTSGNEEGKTNDNSKVKSDVTSTLQKVETIFNKFSGQSSTSQYYGYDTNEIKTNRDSMCFDCPAACVFCVFFHIVCDKFLLILIVLIVKLGMAILDMQDRHARTCNMVSDILNNFGKIYDDNNYVEFRDELYEMQYVIYYSLKINREEFGNVHVSLTTDAKDKMWKLWLHDKAYFPDGPPQKKNEYMPLNSGHHNSLECFLNQKHLKKEFYKYKIVSDRLFQVLRGSTNYHNYYDRYNQAQKHCPVITLNSNEKKKKDKLIHSVKKVKPDFTAKMICFKDDPLTAETSYIENNILHIHKSLLKDETKLLAKCLVLLNISMLDVLKRFGPCN